MISKVFHLEFEQGLLHVVDVKDGDDESLHGLGELTLGVDSECFRLIVTVVYFQREVSPRNLFSKNRIFKSFITSTHVKW